MKFKDVQIGAKFREMDGLELIKTPEFSCHNSWCNCITTNNEYEQEQFARKSIQDDEEVELITKCSNCRWFDKSFNPEIEKGIHCNILHLDIGEGDYHRSIDQNPETFSCSLFEEN